MNIIVATRWQSGGWARAGLEMLPPTHTARRRAAPPPWALPLGGAACAAAAEGDRLATHTLTLKAGASHRNSECMQPRAEKAGERTWHMRHGEQSRQAAHRGTVVPVPGERELAPHGSQHGSSTVTCTGRKAIPPADGEGRGIHPYTRWADATRTLRHAGDGILAPCQPQP